MADAERPDERDLLGEFLAGARANHDVDPDEWHRGMLNPPRTRSTSCAFCGVAWSEIERRPDARSEDPVTGL